MDKFEIKKQLKLLREHAKSLIEKDIWNHLIGACNCDDKLGYCYAGMWLYGLISDKQVVEDKAK